MYDIANHAATLARLNAANWMELYHAQLGTFERCFDITKESIDAWRDKAEVSGAVTRDSDDCSALGRTHGGPPEMDELLACWRRMYDAAVLFEVVNAMRDASAESLESQRQAKGARAGPRAVGIPSRPSTCAGP